MMQKISERNWELIRFGLTHTGDWVEAYYYIEDRLYSDEAKVIWDFLNWCKQHDRHMSDSNYRQVFKEFMDWGNKTIYKK